MQESSASSDSAARILVLASILIATLIIDMVLSSFFDVLDQRLVSTWGLVLFIVNTMIIFGVGQNLLLGYVKRVTGALRTKKVGITLGYRRISCHIVELGDKEAYEVSIIENLQRNTLSHLEEGLAFRRYTHDMGWGGITELARKISKSQSYISKRMRLLELPAEILELVSQNEIKVTIAELGYRFIT